MGTIKEHINTLIKNGDPRSYYEIAADLELERWTAKMKHPLEYAAAKNEQTDMPDGNMPSLRQAKTYSEQIPTIVPLLQSEAPQIVEHSTPDKEG